MAGVQTRSVILILTSVMCFSGMNVMVKYLKHVPPHEIILFRMLVTLTLCWWMAKRGGISLKGTRRDLLMLRGIFGLSGLLLYFYCIHHIPLATVTTAHRIAPLLTVLFAIWLVKEKARPIQWLFLVIAFVGVFVMGGFDPRVDPKWLGLTLLSAVFGAVAHNLIRMMRKTEHPLTILVYFCYTALPPILVMTVLDWRMPVGLDWVFLIAIGILTHFAQYFMTIAYHNETAGSIMIFTYLGPVIAAFLGWWLFDENLNLLNTVGLSIVLVSVLASAFVRQKRLERSA